MKVKPCPFCKGEKLQISHVYADTTFYVICLDCAAMGPDKTTKEEATAAWGQVSLHSHEVEFTVGVY